MVKTFSSARGVFRYYLPKQFERDRIEQLSFFEQSKYETDKLVEKLLENFKSGLEG